MKLKDVLEDSALIFKAGKSVLPELKDDGKQLRLLWHLGFYDGPRTGVCVYNDREHWFERVEFELEQGDEDEYPYLGRIYVIVYLNDEEIKELHRRRKIWCYHTCREYYDYIYIDDVRRRPLKAYKTWYSKLWLKLKKRVINTISNRSIEEYWKIQNKWGELNHYDNEVVAWSGRKVIDFDRLLISKFKDQVGDL